MKSLSRTLLALVVIGSCCVVAGFASAAEKPIKVLIVNGYSNHDWQRTTSLTEAILKKANLFDVSVSTVPAKTDDPAYAVWQPAFQDYDVVIQTCNDINGSGPVWPEPARVAFERYMREGGGMFALHSANNAFAGWEEYSRMLGLAWRKKDYGFALKITEDESIERIPPGQGAGTSHGERTDRVIHRLGDHPIHQGMPRAWKTPLIEVYTHVRGPAENCTVLSWAEDPKTKVRWPIEWIVEYGKGRVYTSTFGHVWHNETDPVDMRCAGFQTLMVRGLQWLAHRSVNDPLPADFPSEGEVSLRPLPQ